MKNTLFFLGLAGLATGCVTQNRPPKQLAFRTSLTTASLVNHVSEFSKKRKLQADSRIARQQKRLRKTIELEAQTSRRLELYGLVGDDNLVSIYTNTIRISDAHEANLNSIKKREKDQVDKIKKTQRALDSRVNDLKSLRTALADLGQPLNVQEQIKFIIQYSGRVANEYQKAREHTGAVSQPEAEPTETSSPEVTTSLNE